MSNISLMPNKCEALYKRGAKKVFVFCDFKSVYLVLATTQQRSIVRNTSEAIAPPSKRVYPPLLFLNYDKRDIFRDWYLAAQLLYEGSLLPKGKTYSIQNLPLSLRSVILHCFGIWTGECDVERTASFTEYFTNQLIPLNKVELLP